MPSKYLIASTLALLCFASQVGAEQAVAPRPPSPLLDYVNAVDPAFKWEVAKQVVNGTIQTTIIKLTSQGWRSPAEVDRTVWEHYLVVVKPVTTTTDKALLIVAGGGNDRPVPEDANPLMKTIAQSTGSVVAELRMVPNQPLIFHGDGVPRIEDNLIGYGWAQFLETGDATWLPRLPMVKSVAAAMDCLQQWSAEEGSKLEKFVVAGASKRGWTAWMIAAVDPRVEAVVPIVIDVLNLRKSMQHHAGAYGFWATAVGNYFKHNIFQRSAHPRMSQLYEIEDPFNYLDRVAIPKYVVNASGDQFFCPDSSQFYYDDLNGEKLLRYVPNSDHSVDASLDAVTSMMAYYQMIVANRPRPEMTWTFGDDGSIRVVSDQKPRAVRLWQATNPQARDFRVVSIGKAYKSIDLQPEADGAYIARLETPEKGWSASFIELEFDSGGSFPLKSSTAVRILPERLPFEGIDMASVPYEPDLLKTKAEGAAPK
jgi:PhoPQ-activated pathogenicity-related protein